MSDIVHYDGFHGTSAEKAAGIIRDGFNEVNDETLYLGNGAYFFVEGISDPSEDALNFVTNVNPVDNPTVVVADIDTEKDCILDLNTDCGLKIFNHVKKRFFSKRIEDNERMSRKDIDDGKIINFIVGEKIFEPEVKIVLSQRTLSLNKEERELNLHSMVPNCIFCCVKNYSCISNERLFANGE